ncbi:MAG: hypothetical protein ACRDQ1_06025 [Sciscionella sp.]
MSTVMAVLMLVGTGDAWAGDDIWGGVDCGKGPAAGCELSAEHTPFPSRARHAAPKSATGVQAPEGASVQRADGPTDDQPPPGSTRRAGCTHAARATH